MTLIFELAPQGSLDKRLINYRRSHARIHLNSLQQTCVQVNKYLNTDKNF